MLDSSIPGRVSAMRALLRVDALISNDNAQRERFDVWSDQHAWTEGLHDFSYNLLD